MRSRPAKVVADSAGRFAEMRKPAQAFLKNAMPGPAAMLSLAPFRAGTRALSFSPNPGHILQAFFTPNKHPPPPLLTLGIANLY